MELSLLDVDKQTKKQKDAITIAKQRKEKQMINYR